VNTTAKTLVGAGNDQKSLLVVERLGLGLLENGVGGLAVDAGFVHGLLSAGKTGGSNNLHGVGDLLNVLDGLETTLNLTESCEAGGIGGGRASVRMLAIVLFTSFSYPAWFSSLMMSKWLRRGTSGGRVLHEYRMKTYRATAAPPARRAGRTARENIMRRVVKRNVDMQVVTAGGRGVTKVRRRCLAGREVRS
jgi:hypothetical protein